MINLSTSYKGLTLRSPIVVAACSISSRIENIAKAEEAGAGALVIRSLFEEQIALERMRMEESLSVGAESFPEAINYFPEVQHGDAKEHLYWVEKARKAVKMPLFASLNAASTGSWVAYAKQLEGTGVDGLELNVYAVATDPRRSGADVEKDLYDIFEAVKSEVKIPVSLKLSPFYTSVSHVASELDRRGAAALVLFNRFLQPDIDAESEVLRSEMPLSAGEEMRVPMRWIGLLCGRVKADLALNTGVQNGLDVAKGLLAGATVVQVAGTLMRNGVPYLSTMLRSLESWMSEREYPSVDAFRGRLSQRKVDDPFAFERAQYVGLLLAKSRS